MTHGQSWLERSATWLCERFDDFFSGEGLVARVGLATAGAPLTVLLPVDRRISPGMFMGHANAVDMANKAHTKGGQSVSTTRCDFWAYCHMSGRPCRRCGGFNHVLWPHPKATDLMFMGKLLCPKGSVGGTAWFGCCKHPNGKVKYIAFLDCCGKSGACGGSAAPWCDNWPAAKDWCAFSGKPYYCTVASDLNNDAGCT